MLDLNEVKDVLIDNVVEAKVKKRALESASESPYLHVEFIGECSIVPTDMAHALIAEVERLRALIATRVDENQILKMKIASVQRSLNDVTKKFLDHIRAENDSDNARAEILNRFFADNNLMRVALRDFVEGREPSISRETIQRLIDDKE